MTIAAFVTLLRKRMRREERMNVAMLRLEYLGRCYARSGVPYLGHRYHRRRRKLHKLALKWGYYQRINKDE